jgi:cytochrome c-type biogenesis protein CcsB
MRIATAVLIVATALPGTLQAGSQSPPNLDWTAWRYLAVLDGGRHKPLDSLAWETARMIGNRASFTDPETGQKLDATGLYLATLLDWQGWDHPAAAHMSVDTQSHSAYFVTHQPDKWDRAGLILVENLELRRALGIPEDQKYIAPLELAHAKIRDPRAGAATPFIPWADKLVRTKQQGFSFFEKKALEVADRLWAYQEHRMGVRLEVVPVPGSSPEEWLSLSSLVRMSNDSAAPTRVLKDEFARLRSAYRGGSAEAFQAASAAFIAAARQIGSQRGPYPSRRLIDLEVTYNHWVPFRFAWIFVLLAAIFVLLSMGTAWRPFYAGALAAYGIGLVAMLIGFGMRVTISGRAPVTDMYESVVYVGFGIAIIGLILELVYRKRFILVAAAAVSTVALVVADNCPALLDPSLRPLQPVLRSNYWLVIHVMTITMSYAAFALALGISNITLGYHLFGSTNREAIAALGKFTYKVLQVGVLLLAAGTILGGVWAAYSWGRFWGWDPKEVWALITLLGYLAVLHARFIGWVGDLGLAALSVLCFSLVVMAWYGVNFVLGAGLHSYGFGGGGQTYVYSTLLVQFLYMLAAIARSLLNPAYGSPAVAARDSADDRGEVVEVTPIADSTVN